MAISVKYDSILDDVREDDGAASVLDSRYIAKTGDVATGDIEMPALVLDVPGGTYIPVGTPIGLLLSLTYAQPAYTGARWRITVDSTGHLITTAL